MRARFVSFLSVGFTFFTLLSGSAQARIASPSDMAAVSELERAEVFVDRRGHSRMIIERVIRINNDDGRERESTQTIDFNENASKLKIILAETQNGKETTKVDANNIEIKPVGDFSRNFDTQKKAKINFPNVQIGSKIRLKYQLTYDEIPNEGFYCFFVDFGGWYLDRYEAVIRSELPLHLWKHDDKDNLEMKLETKLETKSSREKKLYVVNIRTKGAVAQATTQEESPFFRPERSLAFAVSTMDSWPAYAAPTIAFQEELLTAKLPASMEKIRAAAATEKSELAKLNRVAASIGQDFRYFGDWRRRNGGFVPRSLKEIELSRYGDCKDLSLVAVAIYRALGFRADLAWTVRGDLNIRPAKSWYQMPIDLFNHAVARVEVAPGEVYWIDATNGVTFAKFPPQDISDRPAFVLRPGRAFLDQIPPLEASSSVTEKRLVYEAQPDRSLKTRGEVKFTGRAATAITMNGFYKPVEAVNYDLLRTLSFAYKIRDSFVGDFPRGSRIVADTTIPFGFTLNDIGVRTTAGFGFLLMREAAIDRLLEETKDRASDLYLDAPGIWINREEIQGLRKIGQQSLDCDLTSPWAKASRHIRDLPSGVVSEDRLEILRPVVPNESLRTPDFELFQTKLRECFFRAALVLGPVD